MRTLVTGGCGYIGAHVARALAEAGHEPVILDDLSAASDPKLASARAGSFPLERVSIEDAAAVIDVFRTWKPAAVVHLAGLISVGRSMEEPARYWAVNLGGAASLLLACASMQKVKGAAVARFVFSSTAAVYGAGAGKPLGENAPTDPLSPYGASKLAFERHLHAAAPAIGLHATALRYFNAAGAHPEWGVGEAHEPEEHLLPRAIRLLLAGDAVTVYGRDYPTPDGTCIRDYVHVSDLADAHVKVIDAGPRFQGGRSLNVGTGRGHSVLEVVRAIAAELGVKPRVEWKPRRPGDPAVLVAAPSPVLRTLGWKPAHDLRDVVRTAIEWEDRRKRPPRAERRRRR